MNSRYETYASLVTPEMGQKIEEVRELWSQDPDYQFDAIKEKFTQTVWFEPGSGMSRAYIEDPDNSEIDDSRTLVLALPFLNGWTPHHYIRAKVAQQIAAPNNRVIVLPNNAYGQDNYDLSGLTLDQKILLRQGRMRPLAEMQMRTLERINSIMPLGDLALSGYSMGAKMALTMARSGSDVLNVTHVNADEAPSKSMRTAKELQKEFTSGGISPLRNAINESGIPALSEAMNLRRLALDLGRFGIKSLGKDAKLMQEAMSDSIGLTMFALNYQGEYAGLQTKIGFVEGSPIFDPKSIPSSEAGSVNLVRYGGPGFYGHASGDNVITHALMVNDGINPKS